MSALLALLHNGLFLSSKGRAPCSPTCSRAVFSPRPSSFPSPTTYLRVGVLLATPGLLVSHVAGPQREVIAEELHDEGGILVGLLAEGVQLRDGLVESLLGHVARSLGGVEDLVVKHGKVEREAEADGVGGANTNLVAGDFPVLPSHAATRSQR